MNPYYTLLLLAFLVLLAILFIRYVHSAVDRTFRSLARAADDADFRRSRIQDADNRLAGLLPVPDDAPPLPEKSGVVTGVLPPAFLTLGVILLWGAGAAADGRGVWLQGGLAALALAAVIMILTLRRRRWARTAQLLLFRADLRRLDNDRGGAADDLCQLLKLTPWDDSAWAELSDDLAAQKRYPEAMAAMEAAVKQDPAYDDYRMLVTSLALRMGNLDRAEQALREWRRRTGETEDDSRQKIYRAALELARGNAASAEKTLGEALRADREDGMELLAADAALAGVRDLNTRGGRN